MLHTPVAVNCVLIVNYNTVFFRTLLMEGWKVVDLKGMRLLEDNSDVVDGSAIDWIRTSLLEGGWKGRRLNQDVVARRGWKGRYCWSWAVVVVGRDVDWIRTSLLEGGWKGRYC